MTDSRSTRKDVVSSDLPPITIGIVSDLNTAAAYSQLLLEELGRHVWANHAQIVFAHYLEFTPEGSIDRDMSQDWIRRIEKAVNVLVAGGASQVLAGTSLLGVHVSKVNARAGVRICDLYGVTARAVERLGLFPAGILGTFSDDELSEWSVRLAENGGKAIVPAKVEREFVKEFLRAREESGEGRAGLVAVMASLRQAGARSLVLCRPELGRHLRDEDTLLPLVCAAEQQVKEAIAAAVSQISRNR